MADQQQGIEARVKWFGGRKKDGADIEYGYLSGEDGREYFVHWLAIELDDQTEVRQSIGADGKVRVRYFRTLKDGESVRILEWQETYQGLKALRVRRLHAVPARQVES